MPTDVISNPKFANNPPGVALYPQTDDYWAVDPNITLTTWATLVATVLPASIPTAFQPGVGAVVELQGWDGVHSAASGSPTYPTLTTSATTADGKIVGVIQGVQTGGQGITSFTGVGPVCKVRRYGIGVILVDNTVTAGHALVQSTGTSGVAHDSGGVTGTTNETIGIALQALTVASGIGVVYALIKLT